MSEYYVNEVTVSYKQSVDMTTLTKIISSKAITDFLRKIWSDDMEYRECFFAIYLNRNNRLLGYHLISVGGCSGTVVDTKLIFQPAFLLHASSIILAHNHPSGNLTPSEQDIRMTERLVKAAKLLEFNILDHIILTATNHYSFLENNQL